MGVFDNIDVEYAILGIVIIISVILFFIFDNNGKSNYVDVGTKYVSSRRR